MTTPDWAERKAYQITVHLQGKDAAATLYHTRKIIGDALRAERRRAVRVCKRQGENIPRPACEEPDSSQHYREACDDCARAIDGK